MGATSYLPPHLQEQNRRTKERADRRESENRQTIACRCSDGSLHYAHQDQYAGLTEQVARELGLQVKQVLIPDIDNPFEAKRVAKEMAGKKRARFALAIDMARRRATGRYEVTEEDREQMREIKRLPDGMRRGVVIGYKEPKTVTEEELAFGEDANRANSQGHRKPARSR